ncbi:MAG: hypothetical protein ABSA76_02290 [Bacteroidales bacterium]
MKNQFHSKEYQSLMFNIDRIPEGATVLQFFKDLGKIKEFKIDAGLGIDNDKLMRYVILMYDKGSPYRRKFTDVLKRKIEVAHDCEFETVEGGNFLPPVENFLKGKNEKVNKKIVAYVRMHRNYKYSYLVTIDESYYALMLEILGGETKKIASAKDVQGELEETLLEILNQDNNPYLRDEILRYMEEDRLALRPEDIAKAMQEGKSPISIKT